MTDLISALINSKPKPQSPTKAEVEEVLRPLQSALNDTLRIAIDAEMMGNYPGFIKQKSEAEAAQKTANPMLIAYGPTTPEQPMTVKWAAPNDFTSWAPPTGGSVDLSEVSLEAAIIQIQGWHEVHVPPGRSVADAIMPLPYKSVSPELMQLLDETADEVKVVPGLTPWLAELERISNEFVSAIKEDNKDSEAWDAQERAMYKMMGYSGPTTKERLEAAAVRREADEIYWANKLNEPFDKAEQRCPGSTDGSHDWQYEQRPAPHTLNGDEAAQHYMGITRQRCACGAIKP